MYIFRVRTSHPGAVIALCDNPLDANKVKADILCNSNWILINRLIPNQWQLLIAFECGLLVLWDLKAKCAEFRWQAAEAVKSLAWHYEGKYFVSSHTDGSICSWPTKPQPKPQSQVCPHGKWKETFVKHLINWLECTMIQRKSTRMAMRKNVNQFIKLTSSQAQLGKSQNHLSLSPSQSHWWLSFSLLSFYSETFTIFSGGMPSEKGSKSNCITVMVGKTTTVLEMEHAVCDFITLCENPWPCGSLTVR